MNSSTIAATTITWSAPNAAARWSSFRARLNALSRKLAARTSTCRRATPSRFTAYANAVRRSRSAAWREVTNEAWKRVFCAWSADRAHATLCRPKRRLLVIRPVYANDLNVTDKSRSLRLSWRHDFDEALHNTSRRHGHARLGPDCPNRKCGYVSCTPGK